MRRRLLLIEQMRGDFVSGVEAVLGFRPSVSVLIFAAQDEGGRLFQAAAELDWDASEYAPQHWTRRSSESALDTTLVYSPEPKEEDEPAKDKPILRDCFDPE